MEKSNDVIISIFVEEDHLVLSDVHCSYPMEKSWKVTWNIGEGWVVLDNGFAAETVGSYSVR